MSEENKISKNPFQESLLINARLLCEMFSFCVFTLCVAIHNHISWRNLMNIKEAIIFIMREDIHTQIQDRWNWFHEKKVKRRIREQL